MIATRPTRSFLSIRKEGRARLHRASGSWKGGPRVSADLVNRPQDFPLGLHGDGVLCIVRSFNVRTSLLCERPPSRSPWSPASCRAAMLGSQLAILVQNVGKLRYPSDNFLDGSFLTGRWTNDSMAENPANAPSVRSTWLSRQLTIPLAVVLF